MQYTFFQRNVVGERPANIPHDALIFNAPRPLFVTTKWRGDFHNGILYGAVTVNDVDRQAMVRHNREMEAVIINYITEGQAKEMVKAHVVAYLNKFANAKLPRGLTIDEYVDQNWQATFYNQMVSQWVMVDSDMLDVVEAPEIC